MKMVLESSDKPSELGTYLVWYVTGIGESEWRLMKRSHVGWVCQNGGILDEDDPDIVATLKLPTGYNEPNARPATIRDRSGDVKRLKECLEDVVRIVKTELSKDEYVTINSKRRKQLVALLRSHVAESIEGVL